MKTTTATRFETGYRFSGGKLNGTIENRGEYFSTFEAAYNSTLNFIRFQKDAFSCNLQGYVFDRMAKNTSVQLHWFDTEEKTSMLEALHNANEGDLSTNVLIFNDDISD